MKYAMPKRFLALVAVLTMMAGAAVPPYSTAQAITCGAAGFTDIGGGVCRGFLL